MEVSLKVAGNSLDSIQATFLRFIIGGLIIVPVAIWEMRASKVELTVRDWLYMLLLGIICIPGSMLLFQLGVEHSNAATASVLICTNPISTVIFAHCLTKNDRLTKAKIIAVIISIIGIIIMLRPWDLQEGNSVLGTLLLLSASALFGLYSVLAGKTVHRIGTFAQLSFSFILGSLVTLVVLIITHRPIIAGVTDNLPIVLYIAIVVTGLGYIFYFLAIKHSNATIGSTVFFVKPIIAPVIAVVVLSEVITWNMYIGIGLILIASLIIIGVNRNDKKQEDIDVFPE
jgi:drug/metabolite transporter (DMT)-like permease